MVTILNKTGDVIAVANRIEEFNSVMSKHPESAFLIRGELYFNEYKTRCKAFGHLLRRGGYYHSPLEASDLRCD